MSDETNPILSWLGVGGGLSALGLAAWRLVAALRRSRCVVGRNGVEISLSTSGSASPTRPGASVATEPSINATELARYMAQMVWANQLPLPHAAPNPNVEPQVQMDPPNRVAAESQV